MNRVESRATVPSFRVLAILALVPAVFGWVFEPVIVQTILPHPYIVAYLGAFIGLSLRYVGGGGVR